MSEQREEQMTRYVLGEMELDEQLAFEASLANDPELARQTEHALAIDERLQLAASVQAHSQVSHRRTRLWTWPTLAAAALVVLAIGGFLGFGSGPWFAQGPDVDQVTVALVRSAPSYEQFLATLAIDPVTAPLESTRAPAAATPAPPPPKISVDELLARTEHEVDRALQAREPGLVGEAFTVPIQTQKPVWVAVFGVMPDGTLKLYHPASPTYADVRLRTLPAGKHLLPAARLSASAEQRTREIVSFEPGFVLPRRHDRLTACVVVQDVAPTEAEWQDVEQLLAKASGETLSALRNALPNGTWFQFEVRAQ